jgi:hypothetical protein
MLVKDNNIVEINNNFLDPVISTPVPIVPSWTTIAKVGLNDLILDTEENVEINIPYVQANDGHGLICAYLEIPIPNDRLNDKFVVLEYNIKPFRTGNYKYASAATNADITYCISVNRWGYKYDNQYHEQYCEKYTVHVDSTFDAGDANYVPNQTTTTITNESNHATFTLTANRICDTGINVRVLYDNNEHKSYILYSTSALPNEIVKSDMSLIGYSYINRPVTGNTSYMLNIVGDLPMFNSVYDNKSYKYNSGLAFDSPSIDSNIVIKSYNGETLE